MFDIDDDQNLVNLHKKYSLTHYTYLKKALRIFDLEIDFYLRMGPPTDFISYYTNLYENYWDLTTNTTFNGTHVLNSCLRYLEYGASDLYFGGYRPETPPIPTDNGWIQLYAPNDFTIWADNVPFGNAHQLTVQFDMFSIHRRLIRNLLKV